MPVLKSIATGNFLTSTTWGVVHENGSGGTAAFLDSRAGSTTIGTSLAGGASSNFQVGSNITVEGVSVQLAGIPGTAGNLTVELYNSTAASSVAQVTIRVSDLVQSTTSALSAGIGWVHFKFAANQNLTTATNYAIRMATSSSNAVIGWTNATTTNWSRALVTTTNATPGASDTLIIGGEFTSTGTNATYTVTMDSTSLSPSYGLTYIAENGILSWPTTSGNYLLRLANSLFITAGGTLRMGTSSNPIPSGSTAVLEISGSTNNAFNITVVGGTFETYGAVKTVKAKLSGDTAANASRSTLDIQTNWLSGDTIAVASTTTTSTQAEIVTLTADTVGNTIFHRPYVNAHGGNPTTLIQADVANLTRNVIIRANDRVSSFTVGLSNTVFSSYYTSFLNLGPANAYGLTFHNLSSTNPSTDLSYCVFYTTNPGSVSNTGGVTMGSSAFNAQKYVIDNCIFYGYSAVALLSSFANALAGTAIPLITNNIIMRNGGQALTCSTPYGIISGNSITSNNGFGVTLNATPTTVGNGVIFNNNNIYSNNGSAIWFVGGNDSATPTRSFVSENCNFWRNNTAIILQSANSTRPDNFIKFKNFNMFGNGNGSSAIRIDGGVAHRVIFEDGYIWGGTSPQQGFVIANNNANTYNEMVNFVNVQIGRDNLGNVSNLGTAAIQMNNLRGNNVLFYNCNFNNTTEISTNTSNSVNYNMGNIVSLRHNNDPTNNKSWTNVGTRLSDTVIFTGSSPSLKMSPSSASYKLESPIVRVPVNSGSTCTISVKVRRSISTDAGGANYNGNQPRLMYRYNPMAFVNVTGDTVGATMTASNGVWQNLTYTTPAVLNDCVMEFFVDCDGTTGWVNVDDWSTTSSNDSRGTRYWGAGVANYVEPDFSSGSPSSGGERSFTFFG